MIWEQGGKIVTNDTGQVVDCDHCPCTTPAAPCECPSGLHTSYVVHVPTMAYPPGIGYGTGLIRFSAQDVVVTGSCADTWIGNMDVEYSDDGGVTWSTITVMLILALVTSTPCKWIINISGDIEASVKMTGTTPVGTSTDWTNEYGVSE